MYPKVKELIISQGYRFDWIARNVLDTSPQNLSNKLNLEGYYFTDEQKQALADFLGIPVEELFGEADPVIA